MTLLVFGKVVGEEESLQRREQSQLWFQPSCPLSSLQESSAMHHAQASNKACENTSSLALYCS